MLLQHHLETMLLQNQHPFRNTAKERKQIEPPGSKIQKKEVLHVQRSQKFMYKKQKFKLGWFVKVMGMVD
jgi:hypothetical protein